MPRWTWDKPAKVVRDVERFRFTGIVGTFLDRGEHLPGGFVKDELIEIDRSGHVEFLGASRGLGSFREMLHGTFVPEKAGELLDEMRAERDRRR